MSILTHYLILLTMTKEEILSLDLSSQEKIRVVAAFDAAAKFKKDCPLLQCNTLQEVKSAVAVLQANYDKRKAADGKKKQKQVQFKDKLAKVEELFKQAADEKVEIDDLIAAIEERIKKAHNDKIDAQIAALNAQKM